MWFRLSEGSGSTSFIVFTLKTAHNRCLFSLKIKNVLVNATEQQVFYEKLNIIRNNTVKSYSTNQDV